MSVSEYFEPFIQCLMKRISSVIGKGKRSQKYFPPKGTEAQGNEATWHGQWAWVLRPQAHFPIDYVLLCLTYLLSEHKTHTFTNIQAQD